MTITNLDAVNTYTRHPLHLRRDRSGTIAGEAINTSSKQELGARILSFTKELIDVAFPVSNMHAALRHSEQRSRLGQVLKPADTFLLLDRHARRIDVSFQAGCPLELLARPEFDRGEPQWQAVRRHCQTRVHQNTAGGVEARRSVPIGTVDFEARLSNRLNIFALVGEFCRVVQHQDGTD